MASSKRPTRRPDVSIRGSAPSPVVKIGKRSIGNGHPVYLIAEAGVNHNGNLGLARKLIDAAARSGADAVKFQVFRADQLVSAEAPMCAYQQQRSQRAKNQRTMLQRLELRFKDFATLKKHADRVGVDFLATPFGLEELRFLVELGVPAIKVASPDIVNVPLLTAAATTKLPLIVSTGAANHKEIENAVTLIRSPLAKGRPKIHQQNLILLHCVSAYPTPLLLARLGCIRTLAEQFAVPAGFSDHTMEPDFSILAVATGAVVLEKHLTLNRRASGPDHFFSLEPQQFREYVQAARVAGQILGSGRIEPGREELEVRKLARGSLISARSLPAGRRIKESDLTVRRPADGIGAEHWPTVIGRRARTDIPANTKLAWTMLI